MPLGDHPSLEEVVGQVVVVLPRGVGEGVGLQGEEVGLQGEEVELLLKQYQYHH